MPALDPNPIDHQHERAAPHPGRQVRRAGGDGGERLTPGVGGQQHQAQQQRRRAELGHHRVPLAGHLHLGPPAVVDEDQQQRGDRHQLPEEQERGDAGRGRDEEEGGDEEREDARRRPAGEAVAVVAETEDHGADPDDRADGHEEGAETVERQREASEGQQVVGVRQRRLMAACGAPRPPPPARTRTRRWSAHDDSWVRIFSGADRPDHRGGQADQCGGDEQVPVTYRPGPATR